MISPQHQIRRGFTLMELATAIAVISILAVLAFPVYSQVRSRADRVSCTNNLRQLFVSATAYMQEYHHWPQVDPALLNAPNHAYSEAWIAAYVPFGVGRATWICPAMQRLLGNPDYTQPANYRADYVVMPFDSKTLTPTTWPTQPWFAERGNLHGNGNLVILANGSVTDVEALNPVASAMNSQ